MRGAVLVIALAAGIGLFMAAVAIVGSELRQEYHVASRGQAERTDLDLAADRVVWLEQVFLDGKGGGAVKAYEPATRTRATLEARNASLDQPIVANEAWAAWVEGAGPHRVRFVGGGRDAFLGGAGDDLTLPGRALEGDTLLVAGTHAGEDGLWRADLRDGTLERMKLVSAPSILSGATTDWASLQPRPPLRLAAGRVWWFEGATLHAWDLARGEPLPSLGAGGRVLSLDADRDLVAWTEDHGLERRVAFAFLGNGTRGEVTSFPGDQHDPAVNGTRVAFFQADGLVRLKDLGSGEERVLPARDPHNLEPRLSATWAAWLSRTLEGHNVVLVPVGPRG